MKDPQCIYAPILQALLRSHFLERKTTIRVKLGRRNRNEGKEENIPIELTESGPSVVRESSAKDTKDINRKSRPN